ncbi:MAG: DUF4157 domain-containing protein [Litorilinea sp.]
MSITQAHTQEEKNRRSLQPAAQDALPAHIPAGPGLDGGVMRKLQADPRTLAPNQVLQLQRLVGNRAVQRMLPPAAAPTAPVTVSHAVPQVQMLRVDAADTRYEEEADQIADAVVQGKRLDVQRQTVQRQAMGGIGPEGGDVDMGLERQIKGATGGGSLPGGVRNMLEPKLGVDLKSVRVHTGAKSANLNRQLNAKAFTYKNNIFYGGGQSPSDLSLTTHEVVHTMHQGAVHKKAATPEEDA